MRSHIHNYINAPTHTQQYINAPKHTQQYINAPTHTQQYINAPTHTQQYINAPTHTQLYKCAHTYSTIYKCAHAYTTINMTFPVSCFHSLDNRMFVFTLFQVPTASSTIESSGSLSRCRWSHTGNHIAAGDDNGRVYFFDVGEVG